MPPGISELLNSDGSTWNLPQGEHRRQAIAALRGYAYQLHQSLAAWIGLPDGGYLYLEAAEDFAAAAREPGRLDEVLSATQVKDTRESGAVTLNSVDVLDAIGNFWKLQEANPSRSIHFEFLTTSAIGKERKLPLPTGEAGLIEWKKVARGGVVDDLRAALAARIQDRALAKFIAEAGSEEFRRRLIVPIAWVCDAQDISSIAAENTSALIELGHTLGGTPDLSARSVDSMLVRVLDTILQKSDRRLTRADLLTSLQQATTISMPAQAVMQMVASKASPMPATLDLVAAGVWNIVPTPSRIAHRHEAVGELRNAIAEGGRLWLHGATGLGKSTLAVLLTHDLGGKWARLLLRGASARTAAERLTAARRTFLSMPGVAGIIIDDLAAEQDELEEVLGSISTAFTARNASIVITSGNPPSRRLSRALDLRVSSVRTAPAFTAKDAASLVAVYGGDAARWGRFVWFVGGAGHPQLSDVVASGLADRGWPDDAMRTWVQSGFRNDDVEAERDAARRKLLDELEPGALELLARVSRVVGSFDRPLAAVAGQVEPPVAQAPILFDKLAGRWVERYEGGRFRASPLIANLAEQVLTNEAMMALDRQLALSILSRQRVDADLVDTAFVHAIASQSNDLILVIVQRIATADGRQLPMLASAMPIFRESNVHIKGLLSDRPYEALMFELAQHRLNASIAEAPAFEQSARQLIARLDSLPDEEPKAASVVMILSMVLIDQSAFGKLGDWFVLLRRLASAATGDMEFDQLMRSSSASAGKDPLDFTFLAHSTSLPNVAALGRLFDELEDIPAQERRRWLSALGPEPDWLSLLVDSPWLKQSQKSDLDGSVVAAAYRKLGDMAFAWGEQRLSGKCFRAEAIMYDEYANDRSAAFACLARADQILPDNLDLVRERAKVLWRAGDHSAALDTLTRISDRLAEGDTFDAAFAFREAAVSAAELDRWSDAQAFFLKAYSALCSVESRRMTAFAIGLATDAAAAQFASGDRTGGVRSMVGVLTKLSELPAETDLQSRSCHLISRHILLWMQSFEKPDMEVDGKPVRYAPGSASNQNPNPVLAERQVAALVTAWSTLGSLAAEVGLPANEILGWTGIQAVAEYASVSMMLRVDLLRSAVAHGSLVDFAQCLVPAIEAFAYIETEDWRSNPPDILDPPKSKIPALTAGVLNQSSVMTHIRAAAVAMAARLSLTGNKDEKNIGAICQTVTALVEPAWLAGWMTSTKADGGDLNAVAENALVNLRQEVPLAVDEIYLSHLRLLEWANRTGYMPALSEPLASRVHSDWLKILAERTALLKSPMQTVPPLKQVLRAAERDKAFIASVLLAAEACVRVSLADGYRASLDEMSKRLPRVNARDKS